MGLVLAALLQGGRGGQPIERPMESPWRTDQALALVITRKLGAVAAASRSTCACFSIQASMRS